MPFSNHLQTTALGLVFASLTLAAPIQAQTLSPQAAQDLARVFAPPSFQSQRFSNAISLELFRFDATHATPGVAPVNPTCILPNVGKSAAAPTTPRDVFSEWHCLALNLLAVDHIPKFDSAGVPIHYQEFGPHRSSYAMAMLHLAMFEVANAFAAQKAAAQPAPDALKHVYPGWINSKLPGVLLQTPSGASEFAALIEAAYVMLLHLYPNFDDDDNFGSLRDDHTNALSAVGADPHSGDIPKGRAFGAAVAKLIIALRSNDGTQLGEGTWYANFQPNNPVQPPDKQTEYQWAPDPVSGMTTALGFNWGKVTPFIISTDTIPTADKITITGPTGIQTQVYRNVIKDFKLDPPITIGGQKFQSWYDEVKSKGADGRYNLPDAKHIKEYTAGQFWSYDGTAGICAPVRLYNQIADTLLVKYYSDIVKNAPDLGAGDDDNDQYTVSDVAHYYYSLNIAMVDAGIVAWYYKYEDQYWRPVTMIRFEESRIHPMHPSGGFGHEMLPWEPVWYALGAQNTNSTAGHNLTPPFPAYPSGHSVFGGAFFEVLTSLFGGDNNKAFDFQSDELNGPQRLGDNVDAFNYVRCAKPTPSAPVPDYDAQLCDLSANKLRHFDTLKAAEQENSDSRVFLGVHWRGDTDVGTTLGNKIGYAIFQMLGAPLQP